MSNGVLAAGLALLVLTGCATPHTRTVIAADTLARRADAFAAAHCYEAKGVPSSRYSPESCQFADQAREFRFALDGEEGDQEVVRAFQRLWRSYHALREGICRSADRPVRASLNPVAEAFKDVQRNVITGYSYADPALYASGGYAHDPYYN